MKGQNRFIIALLAAGITFATLTATVGTDHWKRGYYGRHSYYHHHHSDSDHNHWQDDGETNSKTEEDGPEIE